MLNRYNQFMATRHLKKCRRLLNEKQAYQSAIHYYKALAYNEKLPYDMRVVSKDNLFVDIRKSLDVLLTRKGF